MPAGLGPWFCALLERKPRARTRLVAATLPHLCEDHWNARDAPRLRWDMSCKVGPFQRARDAETFLALWNEDRTGDRAQQLLRLRAFSGVRMWRGVALPRRNAQRLARERMQMARNVYRGARLRDLQSGK